jgi:hypothetical protein
VFSLTPSATVDEGNNWINVSFGPLDLSNPSIMGPDGNWGGGLPLGNYGLDPNSGAIDRIPVTEAVPFGVTVPATDYYGNPRPNPDGDGLVDFGAVETQTTGVAAGVTLTSISPNSGFLGTSFQVTFTGTNLTGASSINITGGAGNGITVTGIANVSSTVVTATFTISSTALPVTRNISVRASAGTSNTLPFTVQSHTPTLSSISPIFGERGSAVNVTLTGTNLTGGTINVPAASGITVSNVVVVSSTQITATFTIANVPNSGRGNQAISVTTAFGTTNTVNFRITGAVLAFTQSGLNTGGRTVKNGTVTITNTGGFGGANAGPTTFSAYPTLTQTGGTGTFTVPQPNSGTCTATTTLNPGQSCTIAVTYTPPASPAPAASTATITVTGSGLAAATQTSPTINAN